MKDNFLDLFNIKSRKNETYNIYIGHNEVEAFVRENGQDSKIDYFIFGYAIMLASSLSARSSSVSADATEGALTAAVGTLGRLKTV